jgi:hypothetical protein
MPKGIWLKLTGAHYNRWNAYSWHFRPSGAMERAG